MSAIRSRIELHFQKIFAAEPFENLHPNDRRLAAKSASHGPKAFQKKRSMIACIEMFCISTRKKRKSHDTF